MAARIVLATIVTIVVLVAAFYVLVSAVGYEIDCGELDRALCEQAWAEVKEDLDRTSDVPAFIPITGVTVSGATNDAPTCGTWTVHRFGFFDMTAYRDCF